MYVCTYMYICINRCIHLAGQEEARKFYENVHDLQKDFRTGVEPCMTQRKDLVTDAESILKFIEETPLHSAEWL